MSENLIKNIYSESNIEPRKIQKSRKETRVQYVNQDLKQAIKQIKQTLKNNKSKGIKQNDQVSVNPQKNFQNKNIQSLFFTESYKKKLQARLYEIQQRKKQINARSIQKQIKARLARKIQQNIKLKQKMEILKDVQQRRQMLLTQRKFKQHRRKEQERLLHQSNVVKVDMIRKSRRKTINKQLKDSRIEQQQSFKQLQFKNYLTQKEKQQKHMLLNSRFQFLTKNHSQSKLGIRDSLVSNKQHRKSSVTIRQIKTSQFVRNKKQTKQQEDEKFIIEQYSNKNTANTNTRQFSSKSQKKYNQNIRKRENEENQGNSVKQNQENKPQQQNKQGHQQNNEEKKDNRIQLISKYIIEDNSQVEQL